ncbi:hypothetical protein M0Q50_04985 [bacterium]|jgi:hypothetical protein|nr:hypothetical protein [bacterium]
MEKIKEFKEKLINKKIIINFDLHYPETIFSLDIFLNNNQKYHLYDYNIKKIIDLLLYDFTIYDITNRLEQIRKLKKDNNSKNSFIIRYGEIEGIKRHTKRLLQQQKTSSKEYLKNKFGEEQSKLILQSKCPNNIKTLVEKFGKEEAKIKFDNYKNNYKYGNSLNGYIEKYGIEKGTLKYNNRQDKYNYVNTQRYYLDKYGNEEGEKKWNEKNSKISYKKTKQYYIDIYGISEGEKIFKDNTWYANIRKKHGDEWFRIFLNEKNARARKPIKEKYINAYGEEEGNIRYNHYIKKQKYAHTIEYYIDKYGEENAELEYMKYRKKLIQNLINKHNLSNISKELFLILQNRIKEECKFIRNNKEDYEFIENNKEFFIYDIKLRKLSFYDFFYNNRIIEFHGNFWHMNPLFYNEYNINKKTKIMAKEIWEHDKYKYDLAKDNGYKIKIVWELDYKTNKNKVINECLNFLLYD